MQDEPIEDIISPCQTPLRTPSFHFEASWSSFSFSWALGSFKASVKGLSVEATTHPNICQTYGHIMSYGWLWRNITEYNRTMSIHLQVGHRVHNISLWRIMMHVKSHYAHIITLHVMMCWNVNSCFWSLVLHSARRNTAEDSDRSGKFRQNQTTNTTGFISSKAPKCENYSKQENRPRWFHTLLCTHWQATIIQMHSGLNSRACICYEFTIVPAI